MTDDPAEGPTNLLRRGLSALGGNAPIPPSIEVDTGSPQPQQAADVAIEDEALAVIDDLLRAVDGSRGLAMDPSWSHSPAAAPAPAAERGPGIQVTFPDGTTVTLAPEEELVVGRAGGPGRQSVGLQLLSRGHVRLKASANGGSATDLRSTNGTLRRRGDDIVALVPDQPLELIAGDELLVSSHQICAIGVSTT